MNRSQWIIPPFSVLWTTKIIKQLQLKKILTEEEQKILAKINQILFLKQNFLHSRQQLITQLQQCCDELERNLAITFAIVEESAKLITTTGKLIEKLSPMKFIEIIGDYLNIGNSIAQRIYKQKKGQEFKLYLTEEPEIKMLEETYQELIKLLNSKSEPELFTNDYRLYEVITNLWPTKSQIEAGDMKDALSTLTANLNFLKKEVKEQQVMFREIAWEGNDAILNSLKEKQIQFQLQHLQNNLRRLKSELKEKLKSNYSWAAERVRRNQEREQLLQNLLEVQEKIISLKIFSSASDILALNHQLQTLKEQLNKKLTAEDFNHLYQTQLELVKTQLELERLQNKQQALVIVPPKQN